MKKSLILLLLVAIQAFAVDKTQITVKGTSVSNGVVIVDIRESGKTLNLQCTQTAPNCVAPQAGSYWMVRLPKNHGLYDCANVDLYPQAVDPETAETILGEYCLNEK